MIEPTLYNYFFVTREEFRFRLENLVRGHGQTVSESASFSHQSDTTVRHSQSTSPTDVSVSQSTEPSRDIQSPELSPHVIENDQEEVFRPISSNTEPPQTDETSTSATDSSPEPSPYVIENNQEEVLRPSSLQTDEASTSATDSLNTSFSIVEISTQEAPTQESDSREEEERENVVQNERREDQLDNELHEAGDGDRSLLQEGHEDWSDDSTSILLSEIAENWRDQMETSLEEQSASPSRVDHRLFAVHNDSHHSREIRELLNRYSNFCTVTNLK